MSTTGSTWRRWTSGHRRPRPLSLARALFDWYSDPTPDRAAMQTLCRAYLAAGGPGRIASASDFTMLVASRLNFLLKQVTIAIDPGADPSHSAWAEQEIDEALRILPTPQQLSPVLALCSPLWR